MDIFSTAKRLGQPFRFTGLARELPIGARGIIGDGITCALVRPDGAIDWMCVPRFDGPSVFGAILDADRGGLTAITPVGPFESLQRYDPRTNVLETLFRNESGAVRLDDFMPWTDDPRSGIQEVHRRVACMEGQMTLEIVFDPRFGYGAATTHIAREEHGLLATGAGERLAAVLGAQVRWEERSAGGLSARITLSRGESVWMVLSGNAPRPERISAYRSYELLRVTRKRWRAWCEQLDYDGPWRHHVVRSALLLKLLSYAPTGAMVAAPTTSLPEWIGGGRNWDYRYTWPRDAGMAVRASNLLGDAGTARDFFHFMRGALEGADSLEVMYDLDGRPVPEEQMLEHLAGHRGSKPVRIGNGAKGQLQLDVAGALVDAAHLYERFGGSLTLGTWRGLRSTVEDVAARWREPDHGIWEPRDGKRHNVYSKVMCWLALDRGAGIAPLFGDPCETRWRQAAAEVHAEVLAKGLSPEGTHFVSRYGDGDADASLLMLSLHGFLPPSDPRTRATVEFVRKELSEGPFLHRYRVEDGVGGPEGAFVLCGFWLAEALALEGRLDEARDVFTAHAEDASNHLGLLAEEVDPKSGEALGNFPQAFSHLGLINAALRIDRGLRMQDVGEVGAPHLVG
ncbi:MAG: glycoside hydrolase family 15 protein [Myxococcota bacterium]